MSARRFFGYSALAVGGAALFFAAGAYSAQQSIALQLAENDARVASLRDEVARGILKTRQAETVDHTFGTGGRQGEVERQSDVVAASGTIGVFGCCITGVARPAVMFASVHSCGCMYDSSALSRTELPVRE